MSVRRLHVTSYKVIRRQHCELDLDAPVFRPKFELQAAWKRFRFSIKFWLTFHILNAHIDEFDETHIAQFSWAPRI
jgi:hypothetical protein